ncbi:MAG: glycoside hydrolase family 1 protein [Ktedonobacterales bacterium]
MKAEDSGESGQPLAPALAFPAGFRWGVATSSHQYEGGNDNNWSAWERAGHITSGDSCGRAADWWEHAERDFDFAQSLGLNALRLSLEWSRIEPRPGEWDAQALDRYRRMLQGLRDRDIEPLVTLHHFTHPIWFEERGAFLATGSTELFARYATRAVEALGDLCDFWCTINEPNVYAVFGYQLGSFTPGRRGDAVGAVRVQASMARAHAAAYDAIHRAQPEARVGWAHHYNILDPANPRSSLDRLVAGTLDAAFNDFFPRAVLTGRAAFPFRLAAGDLATVRGACDYVGINVYYRDLVAFDPRRPLELFGRRFSAPGTPRSDQGVEQLSGEVYPAGIVRIAKRVSVFGKPIYVLENGVADAQDRLRPWVLTTAARTLLDALAAGVDLRGYYHWSLVDNFEWAEGWKLRFGLAALDIETQKRTPHPSAALYSAIAHANALTPEMLGDAEPETLA